MSYCLFCLKFRCHGNQGQLWQNLSDAFNSTIAKNSPTRRKHLGDISHTRWVIAHFASNFVVMATSDGRGRICVTSFNSPTLKTHVGCEYLRNVSYTSRVIDDFISNFVAMVMGAVLLQLDWHNLITWSPKPTVIRKLLGDISYTIRVIADFVSNFVAMATWVGPFKSCLTSLDSPTLKTPGYTQRSRGYLVYKPSYSRFCPKFRCHGNGGWSR